MRKSFKKYDKSFHFAEKENRVFKQAYRRTKDKAITKNYELEDWIETENKSSHSNLAPNNSAKVS